MIKKIKIKQTGFTLVEFLMYAGIFTILLLVLTQIFTSILDVQLESGATSSVEQDGRYILARLTWDIHLAQDITMPSDYGVPNSSLKLITNSLESTYSLSNGSLFLGAEVLNSEETIASNLNVTRLKNNYGKDSLTIAFTLTSKTVRKGGPEIRNFKTTIGLR